MTKKKRRIALVLVYMLLVIGGVNLTDFAQSHAYFTTNNKDNPLKYQANVVSAYQKTSMFLDPNKPKTKTQAPFMFMFDINKGVNTNTQDKYTVTPPANCSVTRIYGSGVSSKNSNSITLPALTEGSNTEYRNGSLTVEMTCDLIIGQNRDLKSSVTETVKGKTFKYVDTENYRLIYSEYSKDISTDVTDIYGPVAGTEIELFEEFKIWITNYAQQYYKDYDLDNKPLSEYITHYAISEEQGIFKNYMDFKVALDIAKEKGKNITSIPGVSISYDSKKEAYTFEAQDNLLGYARTYYSSLASSPTSPNFIFYFDSKDKDVINDAFDYYLRTYIYTDGSVDISAVKKYINSQSSDGVAGLVLTGDKIPGMGKIGEGYYITKADIVLLMNVTYPINIKPDTTSNMESYIKKALSLKQFSDTPYPNIIKDVIANHDEQPNKNFYATLIREASDTSWIEYLIKYIAPTETEEGYYAVLTVWTDGVNGNNLVFNKFTLSEGLTLSSYSWVTYDDGTYLRLIIDSDKELSSVYTVSDPIVTTFGLDPIADSSKYIAYRANGNKSAYIELKESALMEILSKQESKLLMDMTSLYSTRSKVPARKPAINTEPVIPPLEVEDTTKNENDTSENVITENSCKDGETGTENLNTTPDVEIEESSEEDESSSDESTEEKINKATSDTKSYPSDNISDNPNKEEETESSLADSLPKIK